MTDEEAHPDVVVFETYSTVLEAQLVKSLLEGAGILAAIPGENLMDEFATTRSMIGLSGCKVEIPADRLDDAWRVIAEARLAGEEMESAPDEDDE